MPSKPEYSHACCAAQTLRVQFTYNTDPVCAVHVQHRPCMCSPRTAQTLRVQYTYSTDPACAVHVQHRPCVCSSLTAQTLCVQFTYSTDPVCAVHVHQSKSKHSEWLCQPSAKLKQLRTEVHPQNWNHTPVSYVSLSLQATRGLWL